MCRKYIRGKVVGMIPANVFHQCPLGNSGRAGIVRGTGALPTASGRHRGMEGTLRRDLTLELRVRLNLAFTGLEEWMKVLAGC